MIGQPTVEVLGLEATDADVAEVVAFVSRQQTDPATHVIYLGLDEHTVRSELGDAARWRERTVVARGADRLITGVLTADVVEDRRRVWWLGPWAVDDVTAAAMMAAAGALIDNLVDAEEFCADSPNPRVPRVALARDCTPHEPSVVLTRT